MPRTPSPRPPKPTLGRARRPFAGLIVASAACLLASCAGGAGPEGPGGPEGCLLPSAAFASPEGPRPILVAIEGPVDPARAPASGTDAEQVVFSQMYETLLRVDCEQRIRPGLAESWSSDAGGRRWTFTLRDDLRNWSGEPVTAADLASGWGRDPVAALTIVGDRMFRVEMSEPVAPEFFARADFAARSARNANGWPVGTGPFRPSAGTPASAGALPSVTVEGPETLEFRVFGGDARDAIDAGADVLVTAEPSVIAYARSIPGLRTIPLAWKRVYALVSRDAALPTTADSLAGRLVWLQPPLASLDALARDAVRRDARGAPQPEGTRCESPAPPALFAAGSVPAPRIVYPTADPVARSLAERFVALAALPDHPDGRWVAGALPDAGAAPFRSAGLAGESFAEGLRSGRDAAYVVALDRATIPAPLEGNLGSACAVLEELLLRAPWLGGASSGRGPAVALLVETRNTLVVAADISGIEIDGLGGIGLARARRSTGGEP